MFLVETGSIVAPPAFSTFVRRAGSPVAFVVLDFILDDPSRRLSSTCLRSSSRISSWCSPQTLINAAAKFGKDHPLGTKEAVETNAGGDARLQRRCHIGTSRLSCASKPWSLNIVLSHENGKWSCGLVCACACVGALLCAFVVAAAVCFSFCLSLGFFVVA